LPQPQQLQALSLRHLLRQQVQELLPPLLQRENLGQEALRLLASMLKVAQLRRQPALVLLREELMVSMQRQKTPYSQQFQQMHTPVPLVVQLLLQKEQQEFHTPHDGQHL
jgi:hypothetical protein